MVDGVISKSDLDELFKKKNLTNYELIGGDIRTSLNDFLLKNPNTKISFLHIDVDVYEPTKVILEACWDRIVPGGLLVLDDYGTVEGETKAVDEFFESKNVNLEKLPYYHIPVYIRK